MAAKIVIINYKQIQAKHQKKHAVKHAFFFL
jgi:hypothetical protein